MDNTISNYAEVPFDTLQEWMIALREAGFEDAADQVSDFIEAYTEGEVT